MRSVGRFGREVTVERSAFTADGVIEVMLDINNFRLYMPLDYAPRLFAQAEQRHVGPSALDSHHFRIVGCQEAGLAVPDLFAAIAVRGHVRTEFFH